LKIPKGKSEYINQRRIDSAMAKRKRTNNNLQKHYTELKIEQHERCSKLGVNSDAPEE
jgi:hypothetical protein